MIPDAADAAAKARSKNRIERWAEDNLDYWVCVAMAAFFVWQASQADDRGSLFHLFAACYVLIHAHGRRILAAVNRAALRNPHGATK